MARLLVEEETAIIRELDLQMRGARARAGAQAIRGIFRRYLQSGIAWALRRWTLICVGSYVTRLRLGCEEGEELKRWKVSDRNPNLCCAGLAEGSPRCGWEAEG